MAVLRALSASAAGDANAASMLVRCRPGLWRDAARRGCRVERPGRGGDVQVPWRPVERQWWIFLRVENVKGQILLTRDACKLGLSPQAGFDKVCGVTAETLDPIL